MLNLKMQHQDDVSQRIDETFQQRSLNIFLSPGLRDMESPCQVKNLLNDLAWQRVNAGDLSKPLRHE